MARIIYIFWQSGCQKIETSAIKIPNMNNNLTENELLGTVGAIGEVRKTVDYYNGEEYLCGQFISDGKNWNRHGVQRRIGRNSYLCIWHFDNGLQVNGPDGFYSQSTSGEKILYTTRVIGCDINGNPLAKDDNENKIYSLVLSSLTKRRHIGTI